MKSTVTHITDDLDGSKDAKEISFAFDGVSYTIDLGKKNAAAMEKVLKPYIAAGTKVSGRGTTTRRTKSSSKSASGKDYGKIRAWAREQGIQVSDRGRIPGSVISQFEESQAAD